MFDYSLFTFRIVIFHLSIKLKNVFFRKPLHFIDSITASKEKTLLLMNLLMQQLDYQKIVVICNASKNPFQFKS